MTAPRSYRQVNGVSGCCSVDDDVVVLGDRVGEQAVAHGAGARQRFVARRRRDLEDQVLAHAHLGDLAEPQGVQGVLHGLALRVEQGGPRHDPHLDSERAHPCPPRGAMPREGGAYASVSPSPFAITMGPAISASSSSTSSEKRPSTVRRTWPCG